MMKTTKTKTPRKKKKKMRQMISTPKRSETLKDDQNQNKQPIVIPSPNGLHTGAVWDCCHWDIVVPAPRREIPASPW